MPDAWWLTRGIGDQRRRPAPRITQHRLSPEQSSALWETWGVYADMTILVLKWAVLVGFLVHPCITQQRLSKEKSSALWQTWGVSVDILCGCQNRQFCGVLGLHHIIHNQLEKCLSIWNHVSGAIRNREHGGSVFLCFYSAVKRLASWESRAQCHSISDYCLTNIVHSENYPFKCK